MYPEEICTPMRLDLTEAGFEEMKTAEAVSSVLDEKEGSVLVMNNRGFTRAKKIDKFSLWVCSR